MLSKTFFRIPFIFSLIFPLSAHAQSICDDVNRLLGNVEILERGAPASPDSQAVYLQAAAELMLILCQYDQPAHASELTPATWKILQQRVAANSQLQAILPAELLSFPDPMLEEIFSRYFLESETQSSVTIASPRQKILTLLTDEAAVSPTQYLSVRRTLENYGSEAISQEEALVMVAKQETNDNVRQGALFSQVEVLTGLFEFLLERAKDELVINFLEKLVHTDAKDLAFLFPTVLQEFGKREFVYSQSLLQRLRSAFYQDLQMMSMRLPLLLTEKNYYGLLENEPLAFNVLAIYNMISMEKHGVPLEEIVPVSHAHLFGQFNEAGKALNFALADSAETNPAAFEPLVRLVGEANAYIVNIFLDLDSIQRASEELVSETLAQNPGMTDPPLAHQYLRPEYNLDAIFGKAEFGLEFLPYLIRGKLDEQLVRQLGSLENYDRFFGSERSPRQWRAAGLELIRKINGSWYEEKTIGDIFESWRQDLAQFQLAVEEWKSLAPASYDFSQDSLETEQAMQNLLDIIQATNAFWLPNLADNQPLAFTYLVNLASPQGFPFNPNQPQFIEMCDPDSVGCKEQVDRALLSLKKEHFEQVKLRLIALDSRLAAAHPEVNAADSPVQEYLQRDVVFEPQARLESSIDTLVGILVAMEKEVLRLDTTFARQQVTLRQNATPLLQITEFTSYLMHGLRTNGSAGNEWVSQEQLKSMLDGGVRQQAFLGLMMQSFRNVKDLGWLSAQGLARLVQETVEDVTELRNGSTDGQPRFYQQTAFAVHAMNRILETPLLANAADPRSFLSLTDSYPKLKQVPEISRQLLDFLKALNQKKHDKAISQLIRLFTSLNVGADEKSKSESKTRWKKTWKKELAAAEKNGKLSSADKRKLKKALKAVGKQGNLSETALSYLSKYGDFISGLVDAKSSDQVQELLEAFADPPGSSRLKRTSPNTVTLNGYVGATGGYETWKGNELADENFWSAAPAMPVGVTVSHLFGLKRQSFSLFVSFIDLGAFLTFRENSNAGENNLTFKNVFKPGAQVQWNIKGSPFYVGAGYQFGPQYRTIAGQDAVVKSNRFFVGLGVDVPIRTLYQK